MSWSQPETKSERLIQSMMKPLSAAYFLGSYLRLQAYKQGSLKQTKLPVPVISVGNLSVGGTGKTPVTIDLARKLVKAGHKVGILSRGYMRKSKAPLVVVSDGKKVLVDSQDSGDEPYLIAKSVPEAVVIVGSKRTETATHAIKEFDCDIILLDDGFQHLSIARDCDIVLWDYNDDPESMNLLPAGRLREPISALARANWVVISKVPQNPCLDRLSHIEEALKRHAPNAKISSCSFVCDSVNRLYAQQNVAVRASLEGLKVHALCGIARPEPFFQLLKDLGAQVMEETAYPDHHWPSDADLRNIKERFLESGAELIVTTEKDRVRLPQDFFSEVPIAELLLECRWRSEATNIFADGQSLKDLVGGKSN